MNVFVAWWLWACVAGVGGQEALIEDYLKVLEARPECMPRANMHGVSRLHKYLVTRRWRRVILEGVLKVPQGCPDPVLEHLTFCWQLLAHPYQKIGKNFPTGLSCKELAECTGTVTTEPRFVKHPFYLPHGFFKFQLAIVLNRDPTKGRLLYTCDYLNVEVVPSALTVALEGGAWRSHVHDSWLPVKVKGFVDPDEPTNSPRQQWIDYSWSCVTDDPTPGGLCSNLSPRPGVVFSSDNRTIVVSPKLLRPGHSYHFTVVAFRQSGVGLPEGARQTVKVVESRPAPVLALHCRKYCRTFTVHPQDRWVLHVSCLSCGHYPIPVYYQWSITREGATGHRLGIDWAADTEAGVSQGLGLTTVAVRRGRLVPGATYEVQVRAQYRPMSREDHLFIEAIAEAQAKQAKMTFPLPKF